MQVDNTKHDPFLGRNSLIVAMRKDGKTLGSIANKFCLSRQRVRQILFQESSNYYRRGSWTYGLSGRAASLLKCSGFESREQVEKHIRESPEAFRMIPNVGDIYFAEFCKWLGIEIPQKPARPPSKKVIADAIRLLEDAGYKIEKSCK